MKYYFTQSKMVLELWKKKKKDGIRAVDHDCLFTLP